MTRLKDFKLPLLECEFHQAGKVLADNVKLQIHHSTDFDAVEVGDLTSIRDNGDLETVALAVALRAISGATSYLKVK